MSALSPAESAFAELLGRCGLSDIATRELIEMFLAQSTALESAKRDLAMLRDFERTVRGALTNETSPGAPQTGEAGAAKRALDGAFYRGGGR